LGAYLEREIIETLAQIADVLQKIVVKDDGWDSDEKSGRGGDEGFGDAGCYGAEAGGACVTKTGEGVDDAPNGAEEADERSDGAGGGQPGHAFFYTADFLGGSKLHAYSDGLKAL